MALSRLAAVGRDRLVARQQQVAVGPVLVPPDAAAKLVQLGQAEAVGLVDEDGVAVGDVQARLDDRGADQDVGLVPDELEHHLLELVLVHLAVADDDAGLGHEPLDACRRTIWMSCTQLCTKKTCPSRFSSRRMASRMRWSSQSRHLGDDAAAVHRRRGQRADVADAQQRHVQRARDGRGGHGQHVHRLAEALEPLLVLDAEPLLLVDDHQAEVLEADVLAEQPVRADDDVHLAALRARSRMSSCLLGGLEARERSRWRTGSRPCARGRCARAARPGRSSARARPPACRTRPP